ncbi:MAG TPA: hypothetical protein G4O16_09220 [Dehalococcoidia bacterium]|nr:hypothetical protein [Dehalococcoidia bacterium]
MVWEIVIGVILVIGIVTTVIEICGRRNRKKKEGATIEGSQDTSIIK